jgi:predicted ribosome quality control (RQC) complex YloA/Tae2 family protein
VIITTRNQPDRVQPETLRYAAKLAVMNSTSKHAGYVPVDYTLKKYVRKPRGAAKGTATYSHEKTIHVESEMG